MFDRHTVRFFCQSPRRRQIFVRLLGPLVVCAGSFAGTPAVAADNDKPPAADLAPELENANRMAARVDALLAERWRESGVEPAPLASDAEFLRRATLDLSGTIPTVAEVRAFLADDRPNKRAVLVQRLLSAPRFWVQLAAVWRRELVADVENLAPEELVAFQQWLGEQLADGGRYDNLVADLLTATGGGDTRPARVFLGSRQLTPEDLATVTARIFLGVQLDCAQCHDHPFDHWKQNEFWSFAAFFARVRPGRDRQGAPLLVDAATGDVTLPNSSAVVAPRFLGSEETTDPSDENRRRQLAIWLVSRSNEQFARAAVNRVWSHLFGLGLVQPVDDFGDHNPASHPALLEELARFFVDQGYDLAAVYRVLAATTAYARTSATGSAPADPRLFASMPLRPLSAEQVYDCIQKATLRHSTSGDQGREDFDMMSAERQMFIARYHVPSESVVEFQTGIPQMLLLMNGDLMAEVTRPEEGRLLLALEAPWLTDEERAEILFLAALSRLPDADERSAVVAALAAASGELRRAWADVLWSLLNTSEFLMNH